MARPFIRAGRYTTLTRLKGVITSTRIFCIEPWCDALIPIPVSAVSMVFRPAHAARKKGLARESRLPLGFSGAQSILS